MQSWSSLHETMPSNQEIQPTYRLAPAASVSRREAERRVSPRRTRPPSAIHALCSSSAAHLDACRDGSEETLRCCNQQEACKDPASARDISEASPPRLTTIPRHERFEALRSLPDFTSTSNSLVSQLVSPSQQLLLPHLLSSHRRARHRLIAGE